ncbi:MAG TPA: hypothetical protein VFH28_04645 [Nitrososphaera sp.]|nr:hypothetical protein [Nitrososphaera sp.]
MLGSSGMAMGLTAAAIAIAVILLSSNFTIINAQSQQQVTGQTGEQIENGTTAGATTTFQSTNDDSFSVQVPQGWVIQDANNTGPALSEEMTLGYAILAQLCPEEQQRAVPSNASISTTSCQGAQDVIHIIRYPDLDTRLLASNVITNNTTTTIDNILTYHLQKLQEVGYRSMQIVNSTDVTLNLRNPETNETMTTEPAKFVEMRYSTNTTPDETRRGYFILTATDTTAPNLGTTKGYSIFYEGNATSTTAAEITAAASLPPPSIAQVFDSFELIAAAEAAEDLDDGDDNGDDDNGDDGDDNGDDDNGNNGIDEEELEDCVVSPGRDPRDDCDFTPDD